MTDLHSQLAALAGRLDKMLATYADEMPKQAYFEVDAVMRALAAQSAQAAAVPDLSILERVLAGASIDNDKSPSEHKAGFAAGLREAIRILRLHGNA